MGFREKISTLGNTSLARILIVVSVIGLGLLFFSTAYGDELPLRSLLLSDSEASATATYQLSFSIPAPEILGSLELQFCANDPIVGDPCIAPSGFDISSATLSSQTGETGFSILSSGTNANTIVLTRTALPALAIPVSYTFTGVVNPSSTGPFYGRLQTFASTDASGPENDHGGLAMSTSSPIQVTATVPPYLLFCSGLTISNLDCNTASGSYLNMGNFTSSTTSSGQSQMLLATNAQSGYNVQVYGSTLTSGNYVINAIPTQDVSRPSTSQFGMNLVANQTPAVGINPQGPGSASAAAGYSLPNFFQFVSGSTLASSAVADSYRQFTLSYIANIPSNQQVGVYVATLTFVSLANF